MNAIFRYIFDIWITAYFSILGKDLLLLEHPDSFPKHAPGHGV